MSVGHDLMYKQQILPAQMGSMGKCLGPSEPQKVQLL